MLTTAITGNLDDLPQARRIAKHLAALMGRPFRVEPATNDYRFYHVVCDGGYNRDQLEGLRLIAKGLRKFA